MKNVLEYLKGDRVIWIITLIMLAFSLVSVYSFVPILVKIEGGTPFKYLFKHFTYVVIGLVGMYWVHKQDARRIGQLTKFLFYVSIALLIFTFFFGARVNDAGRWIKIPFVGLTFQTSDFAKPVLILYLARSLVIRKDKLNLWKDGFIPVIIPVVIICALIIRDNFSTTALLFAICLVVMFIGQVPLGKMFTFMGFGIVFVALLIGLQKLIPEVTILPRLQTWENRFFNKYDRDEENAIVNAQSMNAELAIYNGSIMGQGVGDGKLKEFIPEAYADFYYASFVEEFGLFWSIILALAYLILLYRIILIAIRSDKPFETYSCVGIGILILSQACINMMVCCGIVPVTGQNMPLLAMGGSALIMTCLSIGVIQSFAKAQQLKESETNISTNAFAEA
jgi:cell division protein FtsW